MLKIFNNLCPFFEDNYRKIHVREYAALIKVSPPTASKILQEFYKEKLLVREIDREYHFFSSNNHSALFKDLQRTYWKIKLGKLINYLDSQANNSQIILFGSIAKSECTIHSDIDIAIIYSSKKESEFNIATFEKKLKRELQIFTFPSIEKIPINLKKTILNGFVLKESW